MSGTRTRKKAKSGLVKPFQWQTLPPAVSPTKLAVLTAQLTAVGIIPKSQSGKAETDTLRFIEACQAESWRIDEKATPVSGMELACVAVELFRAGLRDVERLPCEVAEAVCRAASAIRDARPRPRSVKDLLDAKDFGPLRARMKELNEYHLSNGEPSYVPLNVILRIAGCDELEPSFSELESRGLTKGDFLRLEPNEKHLIRFDILSRFEVYLDVAPHEIGKPPPQPILVSEMHLTADQIRAAGGYLLTLWTAEQILALMKAKELRHPKVKAENRMSRRVASLKNKTAK